MYCIYYIRLCAKMIFLNHRSSIVILHCAFKSSVQKNKKTETRSSLLFDEKASRSSSYSSPAFRPWKSHDDASNNHPFDETSDLDRANRH